MPTVKVRVPVPLQGLTGRQAVVEARGDSVGEALRDLDRRYPGLGEKVFDQNGGLLPYVNVFVNEENIRSLERLDSPLREGDEISILPAIAGG